MMRRQLMALIAGLTLVCGTGISAANFDDDPDSFEVWIRLGSESEYQAVYEQRFGFTINVPVEIDDILDASAIYFMVNCEVISNLRSDNAVVGAGYALILPDLWEVMEIEIPEQYRFASRVEGDISYGFKQSVGVPMLSLPPHDIAGWTHGHCDLKMHYRPLDGGLMQIEDPTDCAANPTDKSFAFCSKPGTPLITRQRFGREGYDSEGVPTVVAK